MADEADDISEMLTGLAPLEDEEEPSPKKAKVDDDEPIVVDEDEAEESDEELQEIVFTEDGKVEGQVDPEEDFLEEPQNSVEKRIHRERRLRQRVEKDAENLHTVVQQITNRVRDVEVQQHQTVANSGRMALNMLGNQERLLVDLIKAKRDVGDDDDARTLELELSKVREGMETAKQIVANAPDEAALRNYQPRDLPEIPRMEPAIIRSWQANNPWFADGKHTAETAAAQAVYRELVDQKMDPNSDAFFIELTRKLHFAFPNLEISTHDGRRAKTRSGTTKRKEVTGSARSASRSAPVKGSKNRVVLSKEDRKFLEAMGLDLSNPEHVKTYLENRQS